MSIQLVRPSAFYKNSFLPAAALIKAEGNNNFLTIEVRDDNFEAYCNYLIGQEQGIGLTADQVPNTILWLVDGAEFLGRISIRHRLNHFLLHFGGHIGYIIAPMHRKKGYGTLILEMGLKKAAELGINPALVTCDDSNIPSKKIIEKNGGIFEDERYLEERKVTKLRYWFKTS
jgi:predicted acetyltransferase